MLQASIAIARDTRTRALLVALVRPLCSAPKHGTRSLFFPFSLVARLTRLLCPIAHALQFQHNWVDTPLFTNNAAASDPPVAVSENTLVPRDGPWPTAAQAVMVGAGARPKDRGAMH